VSSSTLLYHIVIGDHDGRVSGFKSGDQWQNGIAVIEYTETEENIIPITIKNGSQWHARERNDELNKFLGESLSGVTG